MAQEFSALLRETEPLLVQLAESDTQEARKQLAGIFYGLGQSYIDMRIATSGRNDHNRFERNRDFFETALGNLMGRIKKSGIAFEGRAAMATFVTTIMNRNVFIDGLRMMNRPKHGAVIDPVPLGDLRKVSASQNVLDELLEREERDRLHAILNELSPSMKHSVATYLAADAASMKINDYCKSTGQNYNVVKKNWFRAKKKLENGYGDDVMQRRLADEAGAPESRGPS
jgi:DNA-directed RNA polymerase specialized sigma24 family protein